MITGETKHEIALCVCIMILNGLLKKGLVTASEYARIKSLSENRYGIGYIH
jgi:hypothetical protein